MKLKTCSHWTVFSRCNAESFQDWLLCKSTVQSHLNLYSLMFVCREFYSIVAVGLQGRAVQILATLIRHHGYVEVFHDLYQPVSLLTSPIGFNAEKLWYLKEKSNGGCLKSELNL